MTLPVLVVQHSANCPPARVGDWLAEHGLATELVRGDLAEQLPENLTGYSALVVLGGPMNAHDDAAYGWLTPTKALLREAVESEVPTLGICLGHQLLAAATGGVVTRCPTGHQAGVFAVGLTPAGRADPLFAELTDPVAVHWNYDLVVELPPGAELLATSPAGVQAYRLGLAWGIQFHPEVGPEHVRRWAASYVADGRLEAATTEAHLTAIGLADPALVASWSVFVARFAAQVHHRQAGATGQPDPLRASRRAFAPCGGSAPSR